MTLILVHPEQRWLAADRRVCYGHQYQDNVTKIFAVHGVLMSFCGAPRVGDVARAVAWEMWANESVRDLSGFVHNMRKYLSETNELDAEGDMKGDLILAFGGRAYQVECSGAVFPITIPSAFGSALEAGQVLLNVGLGPERIFPSVAGMNYTISSTYDLKRF